MNLIDGLEYFKTYSNSEWELTIETEKANEDTREHHSSYSGLLWLAVAGGLIGGEPTNLGKMHDCFGCSV